MDKNAIKKYAVWARNELIARVTQKAEQYEITAKSITPAEADSIRGKVISKMEKAQRKALITKIQADGFDQVMEEVAYTWFNRFTALRFMEVNNYLPSHTRVFTNEKGEFKPQILAEAIQLNLEGLDMGKVFELKDANKTEELYKYLLITQCNALSGILPRMFQKIEDYTELLLPDYLLREGSVIERLIKEIPEDNFDVNSAGGQIEIIGWLYQYYISEKHEEVVDPLHGKVVKKEEVPAATQLFTTDWVVRYLIDNSVGRYWIERNPQSKLADELTYFVKPKDGVIPTVNEKVTPQEVSVLDPCMGSAHFGVYAFDVLAKIYSEYGYSDREAAASIVQNNLFGLDIDERAAQLAYFAIMMKAMQYDKRFLRRGIQPNFYAIKESNDIDEHTVDYFANGSVQLKHDIKSLIAGFKDAREYGSIIQVEPMDFDALFARLDEVKSDINMNKKAVEDFIEPLLYQAKLLSDKYAVVATNPPYLNKYDAKLKTFVQKYYKDYSGDLFSVFMYRDFGFCKKGGYSGFMTPMVWMFIKTYEKLRDFIIDKGITTLIQFEYSAFEEATVPICSFVLRNEHNSGIGYYFRLSDFTGGMKIQNKRMLEAQKNKGCGYYYETNSSGFSKVPGAPIAYWIDKNLFDAYSVGTQLGNIYAVRKGMTTSDNDRFLRYWYEVDYELLNKKWFKTHKGGEYRKWYGNDENVVNWLNNGEELKAFKKSVIRNEDFYFRRCITWNDISSAKTGFRYIAGGSISNASGPSVYSDDKGLLYVLGFCNSKVTEYIFTFTSPTIHFEVGRIAELPIIIADNYKDKIYELVEQNIELSKSDWGSFESSCEFKKHPLIWSAYIIKEAFSAWETECNDRFNQLKANEGKLNSIFIGIYGLQDELTPEVEDKDVTIHKADLQRDIRSLLSYAVGCMFGRYSLDVPGLAYAGGEWDVSKYSTFQPDKDAIIPICDDEYFEDDIVGRFVKFVEVVYGKETLEENLRFIADAIGGKGSSREVIRNYFMNDFYADHLKVYQKRPIYWLFNSGKKNGFKCLVYMHRYQPDTIARIRTDYVHEQQSRYRTAITDLQNRINGASTSVRVKLNKQLSKVQAQADELRVYEEKIHHLADQMISIDLDDGVKHNYAIFQDVLAKIK